MDNELRGTCQGILDRIVQLRDSLDLAGKQSRSQEINELMGAPGFWDDQEKAQTLVSELRRITLTIKPLAELEESSEEMEVLMEFSEEDESGESTTELEGLAKQVEKRLEAMELKAMMSRPEDACNAYVSIQAGEGGTDASDWAAMLLRMYQRWSEDNGYSTELIDISAAEEAGIRSATIAIRGDYVYGYLKGEVGNHRLIRISPFDSAGRRQTSFAAIDIVPEIEDDLDIEINWDKDVREDTYRASGAGGQHVNKTSSAIRLTHESTGVVVQCQNDRSQHKNRATARKMLQAKLYQIEQEKRDSELAAKRGDKSRIGFGGETIRSYVLHPQQQVKDHRTMHTSSNPTRVLDGDLNAFIESYLRWSLTN
ncbi:peptide chain release factor 2 [Symmachiella macrocystis]|uniref:peptide chain release factor 2 n=1 Tax=Symmachiella macrocystis TaxID=2527985 RepID=UPI0018D4A12F|nr:peptide chain release factor 2 [Symmachiella macrocystis]